jgi:hypothetical protein
MSILDDDVVLIDDDDGGTASDIDPCDRCEHLRVDHEAGEGACTKCGRCKRFKEPG